MQGQEQERPANLVLSRKLQESIRIGDLIEVTVVHIDRGKVRLSIKAPRNVTIVRTELLEESK